MEELSPHIVASIAGAVIGLGLGAVVQRTNFCAMGAVSDLVVFRNWNRLRAWFLAMAVAILGTQLLVWAELIDLGESIYLGSRLTWAGSILGGLLFGIGMVLAGGCGNRNLVRFGAGDLRSLVVVLVMGLSAGMTLYGLIAYLRVELNDATALELADHGLASQGLPDLVAAALGAEAGSMQLVLGLVFAAAKLLTVEEVASVVLDVVDRPRLAVSVPRSRAVLAHAMRPFPEFSLKMLKPFLWFGERQRRKTNEES